MWRLLITFFVVSSLGRELGSVGQVLGLLPRTSLFGLSWQNRTSCSLASDARVQEITDVDIFNQILPRPETVRPRFYPEWRGMWNTGGLYSCVCVLSNFWSSGCTEDHKHNQLWVPVVASRTERRIFWLHDCCQPHGWNAFKCQKNLVYN